MCVLGGGGGCRPAGKVEREKGRQARMGRKGKDDAFRGWRTEHWPKTHGCVPSGHVAIKYYSRLQT